MAWYSYLLDFVSGLLLANGVPHFVQGLSGNHFQTPFASPPGVGESPPLTNVLWGYANLLAGALLLWFFQPHGADAGLGWLLVGLGALAISVALAHHFGKVRSGSR